METSVPVLAGLVAARFVGRAENEEGGGAPRAPFLAPCCVVRMAVLLEMKLLSELCSGSKTDRWNLGRKFPLKPALSGQEQLQPTFLLVDRKSGFRRAHRPVGQIGRASCRERV